MSQEILVVKVDAGNHRNRGSQKVCRIEPAAQADLEDTEIRARVREILKRHCRYAFKIRRMSAQLARGEQFFDDLLNLRERCRESRVADFRTVHAYALVNFFQVRRSIQPGS